MTQPAIKVEGLWKEYTVGAAQDRHTTFYDLVSQTIKAPFQRLRALGGASTAAEQFWALRDVNFEVQPGEVLGIIGRNGAGKSTLLKILSRITAPTRGKLTLRGRVASLLEVGTGFHPELSGRENIFLNGAILGMTRREVAARFDEIVAFAEVEAFLETPVKRYSSGMYVRLAFAVAAHLETDVLLVDEVLAVGDAAFQRKSLGKMGDVAKGGKTVFFVSHNLAAVRNLCSRVLLFERGRGCFDGAVSDGLTAYEKSFASSGGVFDATNFHGPLSGDLRFDQLIYRQDGAIVDVVDPLREFRIELHGNAVQAFPMLDLKISFFRDGLHVASCHDTPKETTMRAGNFVSVFDIPANVFRPGRYSVGVGAGASVGSWVWGPDVAVVDFSDSRLAGAADRSSGVIAIPYVSQRLQSGA